MNRFFAVASRAAVLGVALSLGVSCAGAGIASAAPRAASRVASGPPVWPGSRVVMVLPLKLGENWNADPAIGEALLKPVEERLIAALRATGKLDPITPERFNPVLVRAHNEDVPADTTTAPTDTTTAPADAGDNGDDGDAADTPAAAPAAAAPPAQDDFEKLFAEPSLGNARVALSKIAFDQPAMIADCRLEELRPSGTAQQPLISVQVSGSLYQGSDEHAFRSSFVTSDPARTGRTNFDRAVIAADNGFRQLAAIFVAPLDDIQLNLPDASTLKKPGKGSNSSTNSGAPPVTGGANGGVGVDGGTGVGAVGGAANGGNVPSGAVRAPVSGKPLPEVTASGDLPTFPQGRRPLAPGSDNPGRFEGAAPATATDNAAPPAATGAAAAGAAADNGGADAAAPDAATPVDNGAAAPAAPAPADNGNANAGDANAANE